jgi:hypothetical protein
MIANVKKCTISRNKDDARISYELDIMIPNYHYSRCVMNNTKEANII